MHQINRRIEKNPNAREKYSGWKNKFHSNENVGPEIFFLSTTKNLEDFQLALTRIEIFSIMQIRN